MRDYEVVYIFGPAVEEDRIGEKLDRFHGLVTGEERGEVTETNHWGKRQLAYEVEGQTSGYYVVTHLRTEPTLLPEFERLLKLDEDLLRYLMVVNEGELSAAPIEARPERDEDSDEDEED